MAFSLQYWLKYTEGKSKLRKKSEAAVNAERVLRFSYDSDLQWGSAVVQASMKDQSYKVEVRDFLKYTNFSNYQRPFSF